MAAGFNPMMLKALLMARSQAGAGGSATGSQDAGPAVGDASSQLQGADPQFALKEIMQVKQTIANYITSLAFRVPAASRSLSSCLKGLDSAIKELQTAQSTAEAVGGPVGLSAIPRPAPPGAIGASPVQGSGQGM